MRDPETVFRTSIGLVVRLARHGLIHCDFNEFNLLLYRDEDTGEEVCPTHAVA